MEQGAAVRELQIPQDRRELMDAIDLLGQKLKTLEERLGPILMPPGTAGIDKLSKAENHRVEFAEFLYAQRKRIELYSVQVQELLNRCEL